MPVVVSKATKTLIVPRNGQTINMFPEAHRLTHLSEDKLVVPYDIRAIKLLRVLGFKVPNPMLSDYAWGSLKPFKVQEVTCDLLTTSQRAYVLNDLGTGKTKAALWSWDYLHGNNFAGKALVVCPISTMNFVWAREAFATIPHRKSMVLYGSKSDRLKKLAEPADIYIINHDGLKVIEKELAARTDIDTLILDELAVYRNNSERSKVMRRFAQRFQWVWGMTGEPMPNQPTDVWAQCRILTPHTVPKYFRLARDMLMLNINQFKWLPKPDAVDTAFKMMQPSVRFSLDDVTEIPDGESRPVDVELSPEQENAYKKLVNEFKVMIDNKTINAVNAGAAMNKLLQVACGWVYTQAPDYVGLKPEPRIGALLDLINGAAHKVLVFVPYRHALAEIAKVLESEGIDHAVVHGDTPQAERDRTFNAFQNTTKYKVLLAHPQCLAHGLTLTAASTIVWYAPIASLEIYSQANARIRRVGQKHRQQILHLQGTPVERKIYGLLRSKQRIQDQLLGLFEEATERRIA